MMEPTHTIPLTEQDPHARSYPGENLTASDTVREADRLARRIDPDMPLLVLPAYKLAEQPVTRRACGWRGRCR